MPRSKRLFKKRAPVRRTSSNAEKKVVTAKDDTLSTPSAIKLDGNEELYSNMNSNEQFDIVSITSFFQVIAEIAMCKACGGNIVIEEVKRSGLAVKFKLSCSSCFIETFFCNSMKHSEKNIYKINTRFVYGLRAIGRGLASGNMFCGIMNLPALPRKPNKYLDILQNATELISKESMKEAVEEAVAKNESVRDIVVAMDGTWQKCGHVSLNGAMVATSVDTGKVIDCQVFSKYCRCIRRLENVHDQNCMSNYSGSSGRMEIQGAKDMFLRSEKEYNVRYVKYLGDGDSKAFNEVQALKPYGETPIEKLECIGHIQKRMGTRLRKLKLQSGKKKLIDGKTLGGKNRLTDAVILDIQKYYGLAIRRNADNVNQMKQAIWAEYFHLLSDNDNPQHGLCPDGMDSWCKYRTAEACGKGYDHTNHLHLAPAIMEKIKPIFRDLSDPKLLGRCTLGKTQNPNESLNNIIWSRVPKTVFVSLKTLKFGVQEAVASFNKGNIVKCLILQAAGIDPGVNCVAAMRSSDALRVSDARRKQEETEKKARQKRHKRRKILEDSFLESEDPNQASYSAGSY